MFLNNNSGASGIAFLLPIVCFYSHGGNMYFIDFIKSLAKKHRIPVVIYLVLNVVIITYCINWAMTPERNTFNWVSIPVSLGLYLVSIIISLSPIGEWILRLQMGCRKIKRVDYA